MDPKDGQLLKYAKEEGDEEQTISPMSIMIECIGNLYKAMHNLGPFASRIELGRAMQTRVNLFLANKEWDASRNLEFKIEGLIEQQHPIKMETPCQSGLTPPFLMRATPIAAWLVMKLLQGPPLNLAQSQTII
ncbi:hypothetical protein NDA11_003866 [Ustilago hordei]|uniref:Uncharacterized protein n=1 Tax=Ustilago hordei TaxID=120017 RepID=I2FNA5_USTHO|nr:uncharacterized protein UHO2_07084 [Ustilago hordei]KAJ1572267.1 hypothetical protein NDA11_003866 [Ustilago hordei]KAJ1591415.1 hypothetical protein NDA15_004543 [Ustilago hordei]KAJ1593650.1 hypothetical protein NDA12_003421 [Ustilago hordei]KAJ1603954.1 hypothetical protein NDA14_001058 [Ustilago hordei]CCF48398.1 uncharacterized protein UHOR_08922 [Ustilago hordei]